MTNAFAARVGFMQGRMSAPVDGRIQAFPWSSWRAECALAAAHRFPLFEWTLDRERLFENPLMTPAGQEEIRELTRHHGVRIPSLTGDCFMQAPFWKAHGEERALLQREFLAVAAACHNVGVSMLVVPLVDNGRVETLQQEATLVEFLSTRQPYFESLALRVLFESDLGPAGLGRFIAQWDPHWFGINYDIGNSAASSFDPMEEIAAYANRIMNVHVKDRLRAGPMVPLGAGIADVERVCGALARARYTGNFILQTARASDGDDVGALCRYRAMVLAWLGRAGDAGDGQPCRT